MASEPFAPMWLSHHWPQDHDRCATVGHALVCRRCAVLYPAALAGGVAVWLLAPSLAVVAAILWLLPIPAVAEWVAEHEFGVAYSPGRQVVTSLLAGPALGAAIAVHLDSPFALSTTIPVIVWTVVCLGTAVHATWRRLPDEDPDWLERHEHQEDERRRSLEAVLERADRERADANRGGD